MAAACYLTNSHRLVVSQGFQSFCKSDVQLKRECAGVACNVAKLSADDTGNTHILKLEVLPVCGLEVTGLA